MPILNVKVLSSVSRSLRGSFRNIVISGTRSRTSSSSQQQQPGNTLKFNVSGLERVEQSHRQGGKPKFFDWIRTEDGKRWMALYAGWGGTAVVFVTGWAITIYCMEPCVHEYCLEENKDKLNMFSPFSSEFESEERLGRLSAQCLSRSGMDADDFDRLLLFESELLDPVSNGFIRTASGAVIGCPSYYLNDNINPRELTYKTHYNRWFKGFRLPETASDSLVNQLKDSLTLSDEEKRFIMSFSMAKVNSWQSLINVVAPVFTYFMAYNAGHAVNNKMDMFRRPMAARVTLVAWVGAMHLLLYLAWFNYGNFELDTDTLHTICKTQHDVDAGLSYYKKILQRNKLLRELIGPEMEYYIKEDGEYEPMFYNVKDINIQKRIESLEELREELSES